MVSIWIDLCTPWNWQEWNKHINNFGGRSIVSLRRQKWVMVSGGHRPTTAEHAPDSEPRLLNLVGQKRL